MNSTRVAVWIGLIVALATAACSQSPGLAFRHEETGLNSSFRYSDMSYPEYIAHMRKIIAETRQDLTPDRKDTIVNWNSPFVLAPDPAKCPAKSGRQRDGILLIHGLTDSPFNMWDLAAHFQQKCFLVYGLLLPGQGTVPGDLLSVTYEEWIKATRYGIHALQPKVERVFVGGFSTGGSLAVYAGLTDEPVAGLFLFAPAMGLKSNKAFLAGTADSFSSHDKRWIDIAPDEDPAKYESFPLNAADQIWKLTRELSRKRLHTQVSVPMFVALSQDDMTVDSDETVAFFREQTDPRSRMLVYNRAPTDFGDPRIYSIPSAYPAEHILNMAHLSLTNAPENAHYGRKGDYRNCLHYLEQKKLWDECKRGDVPLGEINPDVLAQGVVRRLTYNPDFVHMVWEIDGFLDRLK